VLPGIVPHQTKETSIVVKAEIVEIHDLNLSPMDILETQVNIRDRQEIEPKLGFSLTDVGNSGAFSLRPFALLRRVENGFVTEGALFRRQTQGRECPVGSQHPLHFGGHDFKDAGLKNSVLIGLKD
jgi:hypothetical protein